MPAQKRSLTLFSLVVALVLTSVPPAVAAPDEEGLQQQIDAATATRQELRGDLGGAEAELQELEADFHLVVEDYNAVNEELQVLEADIAHQERQVEHYRTQTADARSRRGVRRAASTSGV
jgi:chromosome segregation ATPase